MLLIVCWGSTLSNYEDIRCLGEVCTCIIGYNIARRIQNRLSGQAIFRFWSIGGRSIIVKVRLTASIAIAIVREVIIVIYCWGGVNLAIY